ncbi:MAG: hypothetical protein ACRCXA_09870, partial [Peptostreptococcaceae bacterium]
MATKGVNNFARQVTKEAIQNSKETQKSQKQLQKELEKKRKEEYISNRYKEAEMLNTNVNNHINSLENIINNTDNNAISIEEFIKMDIQKLQIPKEILKERDKPNEPCIRKSNIFEKIFKPYKIKYNTYVNEIESNYQNEYKLYEEQELKRKNEIENLKKAHELKTNEVIYTKKDLYINGDINIITSYKKEILNKSKYPFKFKKSI